MAFSGLSSIKQVKLLVLRAGLQLTRYLRCTQVAVETDSLETIAAYNEMNIDLSNLGLIANDI